MIRGVTYLPAPHIGLPLTMNYLKSSMYLSGKIEKATESGFDEIVDVWEASVRATHDFLAESDIVSIRQALPGMYLPNVDLYVIRDVAGRPAGFMGVAGKKLEMLFVAPEHMGQGIGAELLEYAVKVLEVDSVDVNEANLRARRFYEKHGFEVVSRDAVDPQGNPFPILHMGIKNRNH